MSLLFVDLQGTIFAVRECIVHLNISHRSLAEEDSILLDTSSGSYLISPFYAGPNVRLFRASFNATHRAKERKYC